MLPKRKELPPPPPMPQPPPVCTLYSGSYFIRLAGVFGASAVALGAYGAHGRFLSKKVSVFRLTQIRLLYAFLKHLFTTCSVTRTVFLSSQ